MRRTVKLNEGKLWNRFVVYYTNDLQIVRCKCRIRVTRQRTGKKAQDVATAMKYTQVSSGRTGVNNGAAAGSEKATLKRGPFAFFKLILRLMHHVMPAT